MCLIVVAIRIFLGTEILRALGDQSGAGSLRIGEVRGDNVTDAYPKTPQLTPEAAARGEDPTRATPPSKDALEKGVVAVEFGEPKIDESLADVVVPSVPTPETVLDVLRPLVGLTEDPIDSEFAPPITEWYGMQDFWCAMTCSYALAQGGFTQDGGETLHIPGVSTTTDKGWAFVEYLHVAFTEEKMVGTEPRVGSLIIFEDDQHVGIIERINDDGTVQTLEGNYDDRLARVTRDSWTAVCYIPYPEEEDFLMALTPEEQEDLYARVKSNNAVMARLETILADPRTGISVRLARLDDKVTELARKIDD